MVYSPKGIITLEGLEPGHQRMIYLERCPRVTRRTLKDRVVLLTKHDICLPTKAIRQARLMSCANPLAGYQFTQG